MTPNELKDIFRSRYGAEAVTVVAPEAFQVVPQASREHPEHGRLTFYGLLSTDHSWVRILTPVTSAEAAMPFLEQLMQANFEQTETVRYALQRETLWLVFQHQLERLQRLDLEEALMMLTDLRQEGLDTVFGDRIELQIQKIIRVNKERGQTLESTLQTLEHFYQEGLMGGLDQSAEDREMTLKAWRFQLTRLWDTVRLEGEPEPGFEDEDPNTAPWNPDIKA